MFSFQLGLPSMVSIRSQEDPFPKNIHDDVHFNEDCTSIPPALPDTELTEVSYLIAKCKLVFAFARVLDEISQTTLMRWERLLELDRELRRIYDEQIPEYWKVERLTTPDTIVAVSARFTLCSIYHKALCVLHSKFLDRTGADQRYVYSRKTALTSSMTILRYQAIQNQQLPIDDNMRSLTNYQTSLTIHDYLLAATIITAELCSGRNPAAAQGVPMRSEMIKALETSSRIFWQLRDSSIEAFKAADVLKMLVQKFQMEGQGGVYSARAASTASPDATAIAAHPYSMQLHREPDSLACCKQSDSIPRPALRQSSQSADRATSNRPTPNAQAAASHSFLYDFGLISPQSTTNLDWMEPIQPELVSSVCCQPGFCGG
jgi:hypothetical protein